MMNEEQFQALVALMDAIAEAAAGAATHQPRPKSNRIIAENEARMWFGLPQKDHSDG